MRLPRVRFTVGRLMVAIAIVALIGWWFGIEGERRRVRFSLLFEHYWKLQKEPVLYFASFPDKDSLQREVERRAAYRAKYFPYYSALEHKYRLACGHPWLPVMPDPPEPK